MTKPLRMDQETFAAIVHAVVVNNEPYKEVAARFKITPQRISRVIERHLTGHDGSEEMDARGKRTEFGGEQDAAIYRAVKVTRQTYARVAQRFGITVDMVRRIVDPTGAAPARYVATKLSHRPPPPETIEEAIRAYSAPRDITAILCGDPVAGRSALERKRAEGQACTK